jgi:hypothetical protein
VRDRRRSRILLATGVIVLAVVVSGVFRRPILRSAGWLLVIEEPMHPADVIVITSDAAGAGVLEAADLVREDVASRVAIFSANQDAADREFIRRGIQNEDGATIAMRQLRALGVAAIEQIPRTVSGTEDEGVVLSDWCQRHQVRAVVVVSTTDHSRRIRRVLRRSLGGQQITVIVRPARHSTFDADRWWETRTGVRTEIIELQKLMLDVVRHPFS